MTECRFRTRDAAMKWIAQLLAMQVQFAVLYCGNEWVISYPIIYPSRAS